MKKIKKKYIDLMYFVDYANGRKEVTSLLKKAFKLRSKFDDVKAG